MFLISYLLTTIEIKFNLKLYIHTYTCSHNICLNNQNVYIFTSKCKYIFSVDS